MSFSDPTKALDVKWLDQKGYFLFCADIIDKNGNGAVLRWGYASKENACRTHAFYRVDKPRRAFENLSRAISKWARFLVGLAANT